MSYRLSERVKIDCKLISLTNLWKTYLLRRLKIHTFVAMAKWRGFFSDWRRPYKFSLYNPENFEEQWSFVSSKGQLYSLIILVILLFSGLLTWLFVATSVFGLVEQSSPSQRNDILEQRIRVDELNAKLEAQDQYFKNIQNIIEGKTPDDSLNSLTDVPTIDPQNIDYSMSEEEKLIEEKVKNDQRTSTEKEVDYSLHFLAPVKGVISQKYDPKSHRAVDVVAVEGTKVLACLSGTVIYEGFSQKDGHVLVLDHGNGFTSVYKHNKSRFKKVGDKVRTGDPIALVGNTGENTTGSHLHFELWLNQQTVNPEEYLKFN